MSRHHWKSAFRSHQLHIALMVLTGVWLLISATVAPVSAQELEQIALDLPDSWERVDNRGLADRTWEHSEYDATVRLIVLTANDNEVVKDSDGNEVEVTGSYIVEDWDEQFIDGGPMVVVNEHARQSRGGVKGVFGDLSWNNRRGLYFGFSSADVATAQGAPLDRDRHAFFLLCEGSTVGEVDIAALCEAVFARLEVQP